MEINTNAWTVTRNSLRTGGADKMEFTQFNYAYNMQPYKYGYFVQNPYMLTGAITKVIDIINTKHRTYNRTIKEQD